MSGQPRHRGRFVSADERAAGETPDTGETPAAGESGRHRRRRAIRGRVYGPGPVPTLVVDDTHPNDATIRVRIQDPDADRAAAIRLAPGDADALARDLAARADLVAHNAPAGTALPAPRNPPTGPLPTRKDRP